MSIIKVNAIQHTSANDTNMTLFANGNVTMTTANSVLRVGNTAISNAGISVAGVGISQYSGMMKNRIINGDFRIDQRFNGAANNNFNGNGQYVVDRWYHGTGNLGGKIRFQKNNTNGPGSAATQIATGFPNYFGANVISSNTVSVTDYVFLSQGVEGLNISDLGWGTANASPVTLSFWSYSSVPGTHGGTITSGADSNAFPFTYNINTANTWQFQTITIPGPTSGTFATDTSTGLTVYFVSGAIGSNYTRSNTFTWASTSRSWPADVVNIVSSANGSFYLTGVQLEKGSQTTSFEFRHYTTELSLCQRYYESGEATFYYSGFSSQTIYFGVPFKVTKRTTPVVTRTGNGIITSSTAGSAVTAGATTDSIFYFERVTGSTAVGGYWTATAELGVTN